MHTLIVRKLLKKMGIKQDSYNFFKDIELNTDFVTNNLL